MKALETISYGMYIVSTKNDNKNYGCVINTLTQVTASNVLVSITLNKENATNQALRESKKCAVSILSEQATSELIAKFGYFSSVDTDKFQGINIKDSDGISVVTEGACGYLVGEVVNIVSCDTHDIFILRVTKAEQLTEEKPMTYRYYHEVLKGKASSKAPTYQEETVSGGKKYRCTVCGYIYDDEKETIKFEDLPDDWKCPRCGVGKDKFVEVN
mgnify:CR=1 FL=1